MREARRYDGERVRRVGQSGSTKEGGHATSRTSVDSCRAHGTRLWGGEVAMEQPPDGPGPLRQVERDVEGARHRCATADLVQQRSEEHTSELQSLAYLVCRLLLEKINTV